MQFLAEHPILLAVIVFAARIADVSLGTLRTILLVRGYRNVAALLGFFEVLIWLLAVSQVLGHIDRWYVAVAFAGGFAMGNIVGSWLDAQLAIGLELLRAVSSDAEAKMARTLIEEGHDVTTMPGRDSRGRAVEVLLVVERRRRMPRLIRRIHQIDPEAVCTVSEVRHRPANPPERLRHRRFRPDWLSLVKKK
jgi:uncharacterized protein YebE (UPF0316 family)